MRGLIVRGVVDHEPPLRLCVLIGEIVHALRTVLDHLVWELVRANGRKGDGNTSFPVYDDRDKYEAHGVGKVARASPAAQAFLESLQPYHRGKSPRPPLYRLHHLNRIHEHRALHVIGCAMSVRGVRLPESWSAPGAPHRSITWDFLRARRVGGKLFIAFEDGAELFRVSSTDDVQMLQEIELDIALHEPGIVDGQPVMRTLNELATCTGGVFDDIQERFFPDGPSQG